MKKKIIGIVLALATGVFAVSAFGASLWRVHSATEGASEYESFAAAVAAANGLTGEDVTVEQLADDTTWTEPVTITRSMTIESSTDEPFLLKRSAVTATLTVGATDASIEALLRNITIDGGAIWRNEKVTGNTSGTTADISTLAGSLAAGASFMTVRGASASVTARITVGAGATVQNVYLAGTTVREVNASGVTTSKGDACIYAYAYGRAALAEGGVICNCRGSMNTPTLYAAEKNAVIEISGGELYGCSSQLDDSWNKHQGLIGVSGGSVEISGGVIHGNFGYRGLIGNNGSVVMSGGTITGNRGNLNGIVWGQNEVAWKISMTMSGGFITNNVAVKGAAGILIPAKGGSLTVSGSPVIKDNYLDLAAGPSFVNVISRRAISVAGELSSEACVSLSKPEDATSADIVDGVELGVSAAPGYTLTGSDAAKFVYDWNDKFMVGFCGVIEDGTVVWRDAIPVCKASAEDVVAVFDGQAKVIEVVVTQPESGYAVEYAPAADGPWSPTHPVCIEGGLYDVWYRVTAGGCKELVNHATIRIVANNGPFRVTANSQSLRYETFADAVNAVNGVAQGKDCTLELLEDVAMDGPVTLTHDVTICSGAGGPFALTRTVADGGVTIGSIFNTVHLTLTDVIVDGGAVWQNATVVCDKTKDLAVGAGDLVGTAPLFVIPGGDNLAVTLTLGIGAEIRNAHTASGTTAIDAADVRGTVEMLSGSTIRDCRSASKGSAIRLNASTFEMNGGTIFGCYNAESINSAVFGTIYLSSSAVVTVNGGEIRDNAGSFGSALGGAGTINVNGGRIIGNVGQTGGTIYCMYDHPYTSVNLRGGVISNNVNVSGVGGICQKRKCTVRVSGSPVVCDNWKGADDARVRSDIVPYAADQLAVMVDGALGSEAFLCVNTPGSATSSEETIGVAFGSAASGYEITRADASRFHYNGTFDKADRLLGKRANGGALMVWGVQTGLMLLLK